MFTDDKTTDNYATDAGGWELIRDYIPKDKKIWAPFYCDGKQGEIFKDMGYDITHEDKDFFSYEPDDYDLIIDNPPFSKFRYVCSRMKELDKPFILIMPSSKINTNYFRDNFMDVEDPIQIIIPRKRIHFIKLVDGNPVEGQRNQCNFDCFYYCYKMNLPRDIVWLS